MYSSWNFKIWSTIGVILHLIFIDFPLDILRWLSLRQKNVAGQTIVITGGASGLGKEMALDFGRRGAKVAIVDVNKEGGDAVVDEIKSSGGTAHYWTCDISDHHQMNKVALEIHERFENVHIVVCNAAILSFAPFMDITNEHLKRSYEVNVLGCVNTIRAFLGKMEQRNSGHIVAVSSIAGFSGETLGLAYCSTKFAVRGVMECLQMEMRDRGLDGIQCTTLCPYFARTPMVLSQGMRPTCTWFPFMSAKTCSRGMVDAILKEKVLAFVPSYVTLVPMIKGLLSQNACKSLREYLGIKYAPNTIDCNSNCQTSPIMAQYYRSPSIFWWILIVFGLLINYLAWSNPKVLNTSLLPFIGPLAAHIGHNYHWLTTISNSVALFLHVLEAFMALKLCRQGKLGFDSTAKWVVQTFIVGYPSLSILRAYVNKKRKN
ncbi:unnamed protein product [Caenorhabditis auriculariae]|uniref:Short-chain dehydrogenase/reductase 3 n=1 Tax=Caenorhabditis auriculariae TaxID=2777116 RepID=A0A8S1H1J9_9PELO|nr:unnamed protein product [Caenorhabditis auriculariae]